MNNSPRATLIPSGRLFSEFLLFSPCQSTPLRWPGLVAAEKPGSGRRRRLAGTEGMKGRNHIPFPDGQVCLKRCDLPSAARQRRGV